MRKWFIKMEYAPWFLRSCCVYAVCLATDFDSPNKLHLLSNALVWSRIGRGRSTAFESSKPYSQCDYIFQGEVFSIILDTVEISAGIDAVICSNDVFVTQGSIAGSASSASWTTNGTGSFDDITDLNATYVPSSADLLAGQVVLTLTSDDPIGPCNESSSSMTLSFNNAARKG